MWLLLLLLLFLSSLLLLNIEKFVMPLLRAEGVARWRNSSLHLSLFFDKLFQIQQIADTQTQTHTKADGCLFHNNDLKETLSGFQMKLFLANKNNQKLFVSRLQK